MYERIKLIHTLQKCTQLLFLSYNVETLQHEVLHIRVNKQILNKKLNVF